jgi:hypothetical protein
MWDFILFQSEGHIMVSIVTSKKILVIAWCSCTKERLSAVSTHYSELVIHTYCSLISRTFNGCD